jgi:hypothetical protein
MSDIGSELPIRSNLPGQVNPDDVIVKIGDATNPATQQLGVDASGRIVVKLDDGAGNAITSQVNGTQRALDVGINVAGVQVDPRAIRALTAGDVVTANQGSAGSAGQGWFSKITDGTNIAAVKAASTAAAATDPALVVSLSPNSPLPAGSSVIGSVNQGTSPWITKDQSDGSVTGGTAGSFSMLSGLIYNTAAPVLTTGQQAALQGDASGNLKVNIAAGSLDVGVADKTVFVYGVSVFQPVGGVFQDTSPALTTGQSGAARLTATRDLHVSLYDASGNALLGQKAMAASVPVAIASDQSAFPIKLEDGAGNNITSQVNGAQRALDVGINVLGVQVDPRAIRALVASDVVTANQGTAGSAAQGWFTKITDGTNTAAVKAASTVAVATDPALVTAFSPNSPLPTGANVIGSVGIQVAGAAVSATNPVPVTISTTVAGTPIQNYNTASSLAVGATSNHDYTVTAAKTFNFQRIWASASGKLKVEVQIETGAATGVFNTRFVGFNSTGTPNIDITVVSEVPVAAGVRVRVIRTNKDVLAQDVYSTIEGTEV